MRLLVDGDVFCWQAMGGISRIFREIVPRLAEMDSALHVDLVLPRESASPVHFADGDQIRLLVLPCLSKTLKPWKLWSKVSPFVDAMLRRLYWHRQKCDVFLSTYYNSFSCSGMKICVVYDMIFEKFPESFADAGAGVMKRRKATAITTADLIICISENTRRDVLDMFPSVEAKCTVVYLAGFGDGGPGLYGQDVATAGDNPFILYVGDYKSPHKNFRFLLESLSKVECSALRNYSLVVVSPWEPETSELAQFHHAWPDGKLKFLNHCNDAQLRSLYSQCMAFVYPSLCEGFGIPILEALECGAPVVSSNSSSLPEVGGDAVYYFDPLCSAQFATALTLALSEGRADGLALKRKQQAQKFSWDRTAEGFMSAMFRVVGKSVMC